MSPLNAQSAPAASPQAVTAPAVGLPHSATAGERAILADCRKFEVSIFDLTEGAIHNASLYQDFRRCNRTKENAIYSSNEPKSQRLSAVRFLNTNIQNREYVKYCLSNCKLKLGSVYSDQATRFLHRQPIVDVEFCRILQVKNFQVADGRFFLHLHRVAVARLGRRQSDKFGNGKKNGPRPNGAGQKRYSVRKMSFFGPTVNRDEPRTSQNVAFEVVRCM